MTPFTWRLGGAGLLLAVAFSAGWAVNGWRLQSASQQAEIQRQADAVQAECEHRRTDTLRQTNLIEAQNAQTKRIQTLATHLAAVRAESVGLRDDFTDLHAQLPAESAPASANHWAALAELLRAVEAGAIRLSERGADIAGKADGHASDALMFQQGWPK